MIIDGPFGLPDFPFLFFAMSLSRTIFGVVIAHNIPFTDQS